MRPSANNHKLWASPRSDGDPDINLETGRISVILGTNGAGKTRTLLRFLVTRRQQGDGKSILYIEGNRSFSENILSVGLGSDFARLMQHPHQATDTYESSSAGALTSRVALAQKALYVAEGIERHKWALAVEAWSKGDKTHAVPECPVSPLKLAFDTFSAIFPAIRLEVTENEQIYCYREDGQVYGIPQASEGERQVFALLCDIVASRNRNQRLVIVDEPEAHLNPLLACRVWDLLEELLPDSQFIYATHCISFALRGGVDALFSLKRDGSLQRIGNIWDMPSSDRAEFLGAIPLILSANQAIAIEGEDTSFDSRFYPWLLGQKGIAVVPAGSKKQIVAETGRLTLWRQLAPGAKIIGVVDADVDAIVESSPTIFTLQFNEAESYLCHPAVVSQIASAILGTDKAKVISDVRSEIIQFARAQKLKLVNSLVSAQMIAEVTCSVPRTTLSRISNLDELKAATKAIASSEVARIKEKFDSVAIDDATNKAEVLLSKAIQREDIDTLLRIVPGKELLRKVRPLTGLVTDDAFLQACRTHLDPNAIEPLATLRRELLQKFA